MRVLVVSLHRLGDLLMHGHVIKSLQEEKRASITLFTHPFFKSVEFLFPFLSETIIFEREHCQKSIGEDYFNRTWPFEHIKRTLAALNKVPFDLLIDLSQTETSARWVSFIAAKQKIGVSYDKALAKKHLCDSNPYITYLHKNSRSRFHFIDLFKRSLGLPIRSLPTAVSPTNDSRIIVFQILTSDKKKNWPLFRWQRLFADLAQALPDYSFQILASPREYDDLHRYLAPLPERFCIKSASIQEAYSLLQKSKLLVTLDTAIKHLATWSQTPILELALGSSNPDETGAYQSGAWIIAANVACSPCRHSQDCNQTTFICHDVISSELIVNAILAKISSLNRDKLDSEHASFLEHIKQVYQTESGWWATRSLLSKRGVKGDRRDKESNEIHN